MFYQVVSVIIGNDLCDFYDLYTSLSVTFVMYFNGRNKDIYFIFWRVLVVLVYYVLKNTLQWLMSQ